MKEHWCQDTWLFCMISEVYAKIEEQKVTIMRLAVENLDLKKQNEKLSTRKPMRKIRITKV